MSQPHDPPAYRAHADSPLATAVLHLADAAATRALGAALAAGVVAGMHLHLSGTLGSGKTTLVQGLLRALGATGRIKSPTFALVEPYNLARFDVYHFDFYRFSSPDEWIDSGFDEIFASRAVCVVEWPELAAPHLPTPDVAIRLDYAIDAASPAGGAGAPADEGEAGDADDTGDLAGGRRVWLAAFSERGCACLRHLRPATDASS